MVGERIKELRLSRGLHQQTLGTILGTTQQTISKIENGYYPIPIDLLVQTARYFNVTADYLLGISDIRRDIACQMRMNQEIDQCYDLILRYKNLDDVNKRTLQILLERLEAVQTEISYHYKKGMMTMLMVAICDDDKNFTGELEALVSAQASYAGIAVEIDIFFDGLSLEKAIQYGYRYDLIFLDIKMEPEDGIETARFIRKKDKSVLFIYISNYEQYMIELFEVEPFRFLLKPMNLDCFNRYFREACIRIGENTVCFEYKFNKEIRKTSLRDIIYFESRNRVIHIFLSNGKEERFYRKLSDIEKELLDRNQRFLRIHQSYLVNYDYVRKVTFSSLVLELGDGTEQILQISKDRQKKIRTHLCRLNVRKEGCL